MFKVIVGAHCTVTLTLSRDYPKHENVGRMGIKKEFTPAAIMFQPHIDSYILKYCVRFVSHTFIYEPPHDKTNKMTCAPSEDSDQPGHMPV